MLFATPMLCKTVLEFGAVYRPPCFASRSDRLHPSSCHCAIFSTCVATLSFLSLCGMITLQLWTGDYTYHILIASTVFQSIALCNISGSLVVVKLNLTCTEGSILLGMFWPCKPSSLATS